jgi:dihydroorotate dehydrogenase
VAVAAAAAAPVAVHASNRTFATPPQATQLVFKMETVRVMVRTLGSPPVAVELAPSVTGTELYQMVAQQMEMPADKIKVRCTRLSGSSHSLCGH